MPRKLVKLPERVDEWQKHVSQHKMGDASLHDPTAKLNSASAIDEKQYFRPHVLWKEMKGNLRTFDWELAGLSEWKESWPGKAVNWAAENNS